jgi:hypothetical protein
MMLAGSHLDHAREFLEAAQVVLTLELFSAAAASAVSSAAHSQRCITLASSTSEMASTRPPAPALDRRDSTVAAFEWLRELGPIAILGPEARTRSVAEQAVRQAELVYEAARSTWRF